MQSIFFIFLEILFNSFKFYFGVVRLIFFTMFSQNKNGKHHNTKDHIYAAAGKSLQSCPTLCDPIRRQPTRLPRPWDSPGKNTGVGCHFLLQCMKEKSESEVAQSCLTLSDPMDCSLPGSSVHGIFQARVLECVASAFSCQPTGKPQLYTYVTYIS